MNMSTFGSGLGIGGVTGGSILIAEIALTGNTNVPIESAVGVCVFVCGMVWWLGRKFQSIDDRFDQIERKLKDLPCGHKCNKENK
jgi:hypothetical protein